MTETEHRAGDILYRMEGNPDGPHPLLEVYLDSESEGNTVKQAVYRALAGQCDSERHRITAKRRNIKESVVLNWRIDAQCWPNDAGRLTHGEVAELPGIAGILKPADREEAEAMTRERLEKSMAAAAEFYGRRHAEQRAAAAAASAASGGKGGADAAGEAEAFWREKSSLYRAVEAVPPLKEHLESWHGAEMRGRKPVFADKMKESVKEFLAGAAGEESASGSHPAREVGQRAAREGYGADDPRIGALREIYERT